MADAEVKKYPYVDMHEFNCDHAMRIVENDRNRFIESVQRATAYAFNKGIKANSIVINQNMVEVPSFTMCDPLGNPVVMPHMICGLNVYLTKDELPEGYSFAVLEGPNDRLAKFESIGMEPDELRKAAEIYRKIKEVENNGL